MPTFGEYETQRLLYETPHTAVWTAKLRGGGSATYVVKTLHRADPHDVWGMDDSGDEARRFLASAQLQETLADKSRAWAPIYARADGRSGPYYVTAAYDFSAQRLIDGKVHLSAAELKSLVEGVLEGLIALRDAAERQHGNLKPTNVLFNRKHLGHSGSVVLSDPRPEAPHAQDPTADDLTRLGMMIYEIVMSRQASTAVWPIQMSPEWTALGRNGPGWMALCNSLLDPNRPPAGRTVDAVRERVAVLRPPSRRVGRLVAAALLVAGLGAATFLYREKAREWFDLAKSGVMAFRASDAATDPGPSTNPTVSVAPSTRPVEVKDSATAPSALAREKEKIEAERARREREFAAQRQAEMEEQEAARKAEADRRTAEAKRVADQRAAEQRLAQQRAAELEKKKVADAQRAEIEKKTADARRAEEAREMQKRQEMAAVAKAAETARLGWIAKADAAAKKLNAWNTWSAATETIAAESAQLVAGVEETRNHLAGDDRKRVAAVLERAKPIALAASSTDRSVLLKLVGDLSHLAAARLAWQRLDEKGATAWPSTLAEVQSDAGMYAAFRNSAIGAEAPAETMDGLATVHARRLVAYVAALPKNSYQQDIAAFLGWFSALKPEERVDAKALPQWLQYNARLWQIKKSADLPGAQAYLQKLPAEFVKANPEVPALRQALSTKPREPRDIGQAGPAGGALQPFLYKIAGVPYYLGPRSMKLYFTRVEPAKTSGIAPFYISTREVTVAEFAAAANDSDFRDEFDLAKLFEAPQPGFARTWQLDNDQVEAASAWPWNIVSLRPRPPIPNGDHPMQAIPPAAAFRFARSVGCRLPSSAEWTEVMRQTASTDRFPGVLADWVVRGSVWEQLNALQRDPGVGSFLPKSLAAKATQGTWPDARLAIDNKPASRFAGAAIFRSNDAARRLVVGDIVGNVAEYVLDVPPAAAEEVDPKGPAVDAFLQVHANALRVIGASAFSPPELDFKEPYKVSLEEAAKGFTDVGFRLAFTDPQLDPTDAARDAISAAQYVSPPENR